MHIAVKKGNYDIVRLLLSSDNVKVNCQTESPQQGRKEFFNSLIEYVRWYLRGPEHYNSMAPLHLAVHNGYIDIVKLLLNSNQIDINAKNIFMLSF